MNKKNIHGLTVWLHVVVLVLFYPLSFNWHLFSFQTKENCHSPLVREWLLTIWKLSQAVGQLITAFYSSPCREAINLTAFQ